jgi:hypothetical protein
LIAHADCVYDEVIKIELISFIVGVLVSSHKIREAVRIKANRSKFTRHYETFDHSEVAPKGFLGMQEVPIMLGSTAAHATHSAA